MSLYVVKATIANADDENFNHLSHFKFIHQRRATAMSGGPASAQVVSAPASEDV
jgi:hypothetical protein